MTEAEAGHAREAYARAQQVKEAHATDLLGKANVVGVGVGLRSRQGNTTQEVVLVVMVTQKLPARMLAETDIIPREIEGVPVDVQAVGELHASG